MWKSNEPYTSIWKAGCIGRFHDCRGLYQRLSSLLIRRRLRTKMKRNKRALKVLKHFEALYAKKWSNSDQIDRESQSLSAKVGTGFCLNPWNPAAAVLLLGCLEPHPVASTNSQRSGNELRSMCHLHLKYGGERCSIAMQESQRAQGKRTEVLGRQILNSKKNGSKHKKQKGQKPCQLRTGIEMRVGLQASVLHSPAWKCATDLRTNFAIVEGEGQGECLSCSQPGLVYSDFFLSFCQRFAWSLPSPADHFHLHHCWHGKHSE